MRGRRERTHLTAGGFGACIEIGGQVLKVHALRAFLAIFDTDERNSDVAGTDLRHQLGRCEMAEIVPADLVDWNDGLAFISSTSRSHHAVR